MGRQRELLDTMPDPKGWIERHEQSASDAKRALRLFEARKAQGVVDIRAFDCSGLVFWVLNRIGVQKTDVSSRGLYALCEPKKPGEQTPGDLVFHHNGTRIIHVGVCVGDEQIECRGRDVGVVRNKRKQGYWNRVGRLKAFIPQPKAEVVAVIGGSVRIREGDHIETPCVGIAHRGDKFPLLGIAPSGWYRIRYQGEERFITDKRAYTEVRHG